MIAWFNAEQHKAFGKTLAMFYLEKTATPKASKKKLGKAPDDVLKKMFLKIAEFKSKQSSNLFKRASFGNSFKWELLNSGLDESFVDELTKEHRSSTPTAVSP